MHDNSGTPIDIDAWARALSDDELVEEFRKLMEVADRENDTSLKTMAALALVSLERVDYRLQEIGSMRQSATYHPDELKQEGFFTTLRRFFFGG